MAWIESHQSLSRHQKLLRAAEELRVDRHKLIGHLHELWWWALDNVPADGALGDLSDRAIADGAQWPVRHAKRFVEVLVAAGFIDVKETRRYLHDWYQYAGKFTDQRWLRQESNRQAQARRRSALRQQDVSTASASVMTSSLTKSDSQQPTVPNRTVEPSPTGSGSTAREAAPELTDSVLRYHGLTGSVPRGNALAWINRLDEAHGSARVIAALEAEWSADPKPQTLLGRVETRLGAGPARPAPARSGWKSRTDYDALANRPLRAVGEPT